MSLRGTLHILSRSPSNSAPWKDCLTVCRSGDAVVLIEDGVYGATCPLSGTLPKDAPVHALAADCDSRGLTARVISAVRVIDDSEFVELVIAYPRSITWS